MGLMTRGILVTALFSSLAAPSFAESYNTQTYQNWQPQAGTIKPEVLPLALYGTCFIHGFGSRSYILNLRHWVASSKVKQEEMSQIEKEQRDLSFASSQGIARCYFQNGAQSAALNEQLKKTSVEGFEDGEHAADKEGRLPFYRAKDDWRSQHIAPASSMLYLRTALYDYGAKLKLDPCDVQDEVNRAQKSLEERTSQTVNRKQ